ncbi:isochorismate synthase [Acinetobacter seifertii]|uniref:isochorismate synthase n=1 Tax=Acinetobacter seifertii TaxID=1530123 RepID=A0A7H2NGT8_9GAMM|nr:isochorismate synthase [Acinetobacter seifertii]MBZ6534834.1 isochorismate synthase [Acinetobacter seifertii]QNW89820.1 isochorismate synthase [Acinetobacter seifertii]QNX70690.1 isochorismate synthase [Acinetobacter seifertii]
MSVQHPYFIQRENFTESRITLAKEVLNCTDNAGFIFTTPEYIISSHQKLKDIEVTKDTQLKEWLNEARLQLQQAIADGYSDTKVMGGLPFSSSADVNLMLMQDAKVYQKALFSQTDINLDNLILKQADYLPSGEHYKQQVEYLVQQMRAQKLDKAVLARILQLEFEENLPVSDVFYNLAKHNPEGYNYAVARHPQSEGWFVGASPELLIAKQNNKIWSKPVAGTLARDDDPTLDQNNARALLASQKDQHEHALVIEMIADELTPFCKQLHVPKQPSLIRTKRLWHLASHITGELKQADTHVFDLIERLHPTPAICGEPSFVAKNLIHQLEPFNRELFAGTMGWADAEGNGEWSVTVRCARIYQNIARLFAGAGIVEASRPQAEHAETAAKFRTVLDGLHISPDQLPR